MNYKFSRGSNQGFTLIELLVVIAIIGILASVVLASLNSARAKGVNAAIQNNLSHARAQIALFYDDGNLSYEANNLTNSVCINNITDSPKGVAGFMSETDTLNGVGVVDCNDDPYSWALAAQLTGDSSGQYFCLDSEGFADVIVGTVGGSAAGDFTDTDLTCQ